MQLSRARLRPFRAGDEASIAYYANNPRIWRNLRDAFPQPYTLADAEQWVARAVESERNFAIDVGGQAVGGLGLRPGEDVWRRSAEIGYWLGQEHWGQGIMTEAVQAATAYAFRAFEVTRVHAGVFAWNPASARVLEKAGYELEGRLRNAVFKDGEFVDELLYGIVRDG
jgi:RimJ/RimL family protein N-acetyltransferase